MSDYYQILGVKQTATAVEIKSAYRRLARERHPDVNKDSEASARDFALIALAYRTLSDPQERAYYNDQRERVRLGLARPGSVINSSNVHARRMRRAAAQVRWDRAVDRWLEAERIETFARTQAVFTTVTLFFSTFIVAMLKPKLWQSFDVMGRFVLITLFLIGLWQLAKRMHASFQRYTYRPKPVSTSLMNNEEKPDKPFTLQAASAFLVIGYAVCVVAGLVVGSHAYYIVSDMAYFFGQQVRLDLLFYPPIAVLIVNTMHSVASKLDT